MPMRSFRKASWRRWHLSWAGTGRILLGRVSREEGISGDKTSTLRIESESKSCSVVSDFVIPWTMEFSRLEYWSGQPFLSPGDLLNLGFESRSPTLQADYLPAEPQGKPTLKITESGKAGRVGGCYTIWRQQWLGEVGLGKRRKVMRETVEGGYFILAMQK